MRQRFIQRFSTSGDVQTALDNETLGKPYVALVSGSGLDYNSLEPVQPCYLGEWSDNGQGTYTFHILDTGNTAWVNVVSIAQLFDLYTTGDGPYDMDVRLSLTLGEPNLWSMEFHVDDVSDTPSQEFYEGSSEYWNSGAMVNPNESVSSVDVTWDGVDTFTLHQDELNINTINPECPEEGPSD